MNSVEQQIKQLGEKVDLYNKMDEIAKVNNVAMYNEIVKQKELCTDMLDNYKTAVSKVGNSACEVNGNVGDLVATVNKIKAATEGGDVKLEDLVSNYVELAKVRGGLNKFLENKKMEIIKVD